LQPNSKWTDFGEPTEQLVTRALDDEISQRCATTFLKSLDPWKVYFYQSDVDEFMQHQN